MKIGGRCFFISSLFLSWYDCRKGAIMMEQREQTEQKEQQEQVFLCEDCGYPQRGTKPPIYCVKCESDAPEDACWTGV